MPILRKKKAGALEGRCRVVDGGGVDVGLAEREPQLGQVGHLVHLPARRFEQDGRAHPAVGCRAARRWCRSRGPGRGPPRLAMSASMAASRRDSPSLSEHDGTELRDVKRSGPQRDQRLVASRPELLARRPGDPLRQHRQRPPGLLELSERAPFALEHRQRRRVERIARLEAPPKVLAPSALGARRVDRGPFGRQPGGALEAPVGVGLGDPAGGSCRGPRSSKSRRRTTSLISDSSLAMRSWATRRTTLVMRSCHS